MLNMLARFRRLIGNRIRVSTGAACVCLLPLSLFGCNRAETQRVKEEPTPQAATEERTLVVFAATSLRDVFNTLGEDFKHQHPQVEVTFNFAGTQELRTQLEQGAHADVFASADEKHMDALLRAGRVTAPALFARNEPVLVVSTEASALIREFLDLPKATRIVLGSAEVPIGRYAQTILERASVGPHPDFKSRVEAHVVSRELNVRQVLAKVSLGDAQAGIVYRTDVGSAHSQVQVVPIPSEFNVVARYPVAIIASCEHPKLAQEFVELLTSVQGQRLLQQAGFLPAASSAASSAATSSSEPPR